MMRMMARLDQGRLEEKEKQDGQSRETSAAGDEDEAPALPAVLRPSRLARERTNLARVGKTETTVSMVSPLTSHLAGDDRS